MGRLNTMDNRFIVVDVESTLELDSEGASIPIGPSGSCSEVIYLFWHGL